MSVRSHLQRLERRGLYEARPPRSPEHVYERIKREARESIVESLAAGEEPIYRIAENGDVLAAGGRTVNHYGDFAPVLDDHIHALDDHIAKLEREEAIIEDRREREH
jgi:hypothetical protein